MKNKNWLKPFKFFKFKKKSKSNNKQDPLKAHKRFAKGLFNTTTTLVSLVAGGHISLIIFAIVIGVSLLLIITMLLIPQGAIFNPNYQIDRPFENDRIVQNANSYVNYQAAMNHLQPDRLQWTLVTTAVINDQTMVFKIPPDVQRTIFNHLDQLALNQGTVRNIDLVSLATSNQKINNQSLDDLIDRFFVAALAHQKIIIKFAFIERYLMAQSIPNWATTNRIEQMIEPTMFVFSPFASSQIFKQSAIGGILPSSSQPVGVVANKGHYQLKQIIATVLENSQVPTGAALFQLNHANNNYDWIMLNQLTSPMLGFDIATSKTRYLSFDQFINQADHRGTIITMPPTGIFQSPLDFFNTLATTLITLIPDLPIFQVQIRADAFIKNEIIEQGFEWPDLFSIGDNLATKDIILDVRAPWGNDGAFVMDNLESSHGQAGTLEKWSQVNNYQLFFNATVKNFNHRFNNTIPLSDSLLRPADYNFFLTDDQGQLISPDQNLNGWKNLTTIDQLNDPLVNRRFQYVYKDVSLNWLKQNFDPLVMALNQPLTTFNDLASQSRSQIQSYFDQVRPDAFINSINLGASFNLKANHDVISAQNAINQDIPIYDIDWPGVDNQHHRNNTQLDNDPLSFNDRFLPKYRYLDAQGQIQYISDSSWSAANLAMSDRHTISYLSKRAKMTNIATNPDSANALNLKALDIGYKNRFQFELEPIANVANGIISKQDLADLPANRLFVLPPKQSVKYMNNNIPVIYRDEAWNQNYDLDRNHANSGGWNMTTQAPMISTKAFNQRANVRFNIPTGLYFNQQYLHPDHQQINWNDVVQRTISEPKANQAYWKAQRADNGDHAFININNLLKKAALKNFNNQEQTTSQSDVYIYKAAIDQSEPTLSGQSRNQFGSTLLPQFNRFLNLNLTLSDQLFTFKNNQAYFSLAKLLTNVVNPLVQDLIINNQSFHKIDHVSPSAINKLFPNSFQRAFVNIDHQRLNQLLPTFKKLLTQLEKQWIYLNQDQTDFNQLAYKIANNWSDVILLNLVPRLGDQFQAPLALNKVLLIDPQKHFSPFGIQSDFDQLLKFNRHTYNDFYQPLDPNSIQDRFLNEIPAGDQTTWDRLLNNINQNNYLQRLMLNQAWDEMHRSLFGTSAPLSATFLKEYGFNTSEGNAVNVWGPGLVNQYPKFLFSNFVGTGGLNPFGYQGYYFGINSNFLTTAGAGAENLFTQYSMVTRDPWFFGSIWSPDTLKRDALWLTSNNAKWMPTRKEFIDSWWNNDPGFDEKTTSFSQTDLVLNPWLNRANPLDPTIPYLIQVINIPNQMQPSTNFYQTNRGQAIFSPIWAPFKNLSSLDQFLINGTTTITTQIQRLTKPNLYQGDWQLNTYSPQQAWLYNLLLGWNAKVITNRGFIVTDASFDWDHHQITNFQIQQAILFQSPPAINQSFDLDANQNLSQQWIDQLFLAWKDLLKIDPGQLPDKTVLNQDALTPTIPNYDAKPVLSATNDQIIKLDYQALALDLNKYWNDLVGSTPTDPNYQNRFNGNALSVVSELIYRLLELNKLWADLNHEQTLDLNLAFNKLKLTNKSLVNDLITNLATLDDLLKTDVAYKPLIFLKNRIINWLYYLEQMPFANQSSLSQMVANNFVHHALTFRNQINQAFININQLYEALIFKNFDQIFGDQTNTIEVDPNTFVTLISQQITLLANQFAASHNQPPTTVNPTLVSPIQTTIVAISRFANQIVNPTIKNQIDQAINYWNLVLPDLPIDPLIDQNKIINFLTTSDQVQINLTLMNLINLQSWLNTDFDGNNNAVIKNELNMQIQFRNNLNLIGTIFGFEQRFDQIIHFDQKPNS